MTLIENEDYQLVPTGDVSWSIRILKGEFVETVVSGIVLAYNEETDTLGFSFEIEQSPDPDLSVSNTNLQYLIGDIVASIIEDDKGSIHSE